MGLRLRGRRGGRGGGRGGWWRLGFGIWVGGRGVVMEEEEEEEEMVGVEVEGMEGGVRVVWIDYIWSSSSRYQSLFFQFLKPAFVREIMHFVYPSMPSPQIKRKKGIYPSMINLQHRQPQHTHDQRQRSRNLRSRTGMFLRRPSRRRRPRARRQIPRLRRNARYVSAGQSRPGCHARRQHRLARHKRALRALRLRLIRRHADTRRRGRLFDLAFALNRRSRGRRRRTSGAPSGEEVRGVGGGALVGSATGDGGLRGSTATAAVEEGADFAVGRVPVDHGGAAEGDGLGGGAAFEVGLCEHGGRKGEEGEGGLHFEGVCLEGVGFGG